MSWKFLFTKSFNLMLALLFGTISEHGKSCVQLDK